MLQLENPFWTFSLDVYARPGVAQECLALQASDGIDVNVLLFCAWAGAVREVRLGDEQIAAVIGRAKPWHERVVVPLRGVRQALKEMTGLGDSVTALRKDVAAAELKAEQIEQATLFADAASLLDGAGAAGAPDAVSANLSCLLRHYHAGSVVPERLIAAALAFAALH